MYNNCYETCGVSNGTCKNHYCEANPRYTPPAVKEKPKGGPGRPAKVTARSMIKKETSPQSFINYVSNYD